MAGDGWVKMPDGPERWVRLLPNGYEMEIKYDREDREDLYASIVEGSNFESAIEFSASLEGFLAEIRRQGILDILRPYWFSTIGVKLLELARLEDRTGGGVPAYVDQLIDRQLERLRRMRIPASFYLSNPNLTPIKLVSGWKQHFLGGEKRFRDYLASPAMRGVSFPSDGAWAWEHPSLKYLRRGFWRELALLAGFVPGHVSICDMKAPLSVGDRGLVLLHECRAICDDIESHHAVGCDLTMALITRHLLRILIRVNDDQELLRLVYAYFRDQGTHKEGLQRHLMEVVATGPKRFDRAPTYPQRVSFMTIGEIPPDVAECLGVIGRDGARGAAAIEGDIVDGATSNPATGDWTGLVRDDGTIDMKKRGEFAASFEGVKMRIELARVLALAIIDNKKCKLIRAPTVYRWVGFDRRSLKHRTNPRPDETSHPSRLDEVKRGNKSDRGVVFYTRGSVLRHLAAKYGALNKQDLVSAGAWKARTLDTE